MDKEIIDSALKSNLIKQVYDDALSPAAKQLGLFSEDFIKTIRLIGYPIQYFSSVQDRVAKRLKDSINQSST
ncbi:TPA: hypothetical protein ACPY6J_000617 [Yersinia enterocolitica]